MSTLLLLAAGLASYGGFACLALAMPRHWAAAGGQGAAPPRRRLRAGGFALLALAYTILLGRDGSAFGSVLWVLLLTAAAVAVALTLAWLPRGGGRG